MARVFLSYKHALPDSTIARRVFEELHRRHHDVFFDEELRIGDRWNAKIQAALEECEYFVALVSLSYLNSTFILEHELGPAVERLKSESLKGLLHVNLAYDGTSPGEVGDVLDAIQFFKWKSDADTQRLVDVIVESLPDSQLLVRGAEAFDELDAALFPTLGRESAIGEIVARIESRERPHVLLHGVSGAGKTSFLRAGVQPRVDGMTVLELTRSTADELRQAATRPGLLAFDQFEQVLIALSRDDGERVRFAEAVAELTASGRRFLFCVRDEMRSAFGKMLPAVDRDCMPFALFPFEPAEAAEVLEKLLGNARVEYSPEVLLPLCRAMSDGTPPTVLPAVLQMIVQHCRERGIRLTPAIRDELQRKDAHALFVDHLRETVSARLPRSVPELDAARALHALTSGDVKSQPKTIPGIAEEEALAPARVARALAVASASGARVVTIDRAGADGEEARYRLAHDLFVPAVRRMYTRAKVRRQWRNGILTVAVLLALLAGLSLLPRSQTLALVARREFDQAVTDAQQERREAAALHAARAYELAGSRDPLRATYALAALHASLALAPPIVLPDANEFRAVILNEQVVVRALPGVNGTLVHPPDGRRPWKLPPLAPGMGIAASDDAAWIAGTFEEGYPTSTSAILRNGAPGRVPWENAPQGGTVIFSEDASLLVADLYDRIHVWSRETGKQVQHIPRARSEPAFCLRSGAERVLFVNEDGLQLVDLRTGVSRSVERRGVFGPARFSGDGRYFATVESGGTLTLWNAATLTPQKEVALKRAQDKPVSAWRVDDVNTDGSKVVGIGDDERVFLADTVTSHVYTRHIDDVDFHHVSGIGDPAQRFRFLPGDRAFLSLGGGSQFTATSDGPNHVPIGPYVVKTWTANGRFEQWGPVIRLPQSTFPLEASRDGQLRAVLHDRRVLKWDLRPRLDILSVLPGPPIASTSLAQLAPDLRFALVEFPEHRERPQRAVDLRTREYVDEALPRDGPVPHLKLLHNRFVVQHWSVAEEMQSGQPARVQVLDLLTKRLLLAEPVRIRLSVRDVAIDAAGTELRLLGSGFGRDARQRVVRVSVPSGAIAEPHYVADDARRFVGDAGDTLVDVTISEDERLSFRLWRTFGPEQTHTFELNRSAMDFDVVSALLRQAQARIEAIDRVVITAASGAAFRFVRGAGGSVAVADAKSGAPVVFPRPAHDNFEAAAFSRDGRLVLLMEQKGTDDAVQVWDLTIGRPVTQRVELTRGIAGGTFTEDDGAVAILSDDGVLRRIYVGRREPYARSWRKTSGAWLRDLAMVATGMRLSESEAIVPLTDEEHRDARKRLEHALRRAAPRDTNARYALQRLGWK